MRRLAARLVACLCFLGVAAPSASAGLISFDFNGLADGDGNSTVQTYLNGILAIAHPGGAVTVSGSQAENNYTGEGYVVGPVSGSFVNPETLGTSDWGVHHSGPLDTFLVNQSAFDRITMTFSFPIYSASFDYEIFPDGTCPQSSPSCQPVTANWPDFTFAAGSTVQFRTLSVVPGTFGTFPHSPNSGIVLNELAPQFLGLSGNWDFPSGVTTLEFIDWPRMIGMDNLRLTDVVPEPASVFLMGSGFLGLLGWGTLKKRG